MDQIAGELGMSKRTLYELFRDKDDLLMHCLIEMGRNFRNQVHSIISESDNIIEAMFRIADHSERKKASANILFFEDLDKYYPQLRDRLRIEAEGEESIFIKILKMGIREDIFKKDLHITVVEKFIQEMMKICGNKNIFPADTENNILIKNIIIPYFLGISTGKGQQLIELHFNKIE